MTLPEIMTRTEVAQLLRVSEPHVVKLVKTAGLPGVQLGDKRAPWRFRREAVLEWMKAQEGKVA